MSRAPRLARTVLSILAVLSVVWGLAFSQPAEDLLRVGLGAYRDGFLEVAESQWRKFLDLYPDHPLVPQVRYLLARTLLDMGKEREALRELEALRGQKALDQAELHYLIGRIYFDLGDWEGAKASLGQALLLGPKAPWRGDALLMLGEVLFKLGDHEGAAARLREALGSLSEGSKRGRAAFLLGLSLMELGKPQEAVEAFLQVKGKDLPEALLWLSEAYRRMGDLQKAIGALERLRTDHPKDPRVPEALYREALLLVEEGNLTGARGLLSEFLSAHKNHPLEPKARLLLGRILMSLGDYRRAPDVLRPLLKKGTPEEQTEARYRLAWIYLRQGNVAEAERLLSGIEDPLAHLFKAKVELYEGKCEEAMPYLFELSGKKPFRAFSLFEIARCNWKKGKFEDCVANLDVLQLEFPHLEKADEVLWLKAECLREAGQREKAKATYELLVAKGPSSERFPWALYRLVEMALGNERTSDALSSFRRLKEYAPAHELTSRAALAVGKALFVKGQYEEALEAFEVGSSSPIREIRAESTSWLGKTYWRLGKVDEALSAFRQAALQGGEMAALAYVEIGNIYSELDQREEARAAYQEALRYAQDEALRGRIQRLLDFLDRNP